MSQIKMAEKKGKNKAFWPLIGFVLAISIGVLAWFIKDPVYTWLANGPIPNFPPPGIAPATMKLLVAAAIFTVLAGVGALIIAMAVPKSTSRVKEQDLVNERKGALKEKELKKARQREINRQMKSGR